jgi:hypothetical protein
MVLAIRLGKGALMRAKAQKQSWWAVMYGGLYFLAGS